jgi:hypothetical protein
MWQSIQTILTDRGHWPHEARALALRLLSADPACPAAAGETPYWTALYSLPLDPAADPEQLARLAAPERRPPVLKDVDVLAAIPGPDMCRQWLRSIVEAELRGLAALEEALRTGQDAADREHVVQRAQLLSDGAASRQYRRYHGEASSRLLRASDKLPRVLERDATGFFEDLDATFNERHSEPAFDGGEEGAVAPASDVAPEETAPGQTHDDFTDEPSEEPEDAIQAPGASTLASDGPNDDEPSVRDPAEPTAVAPSAPRARRRRLSRSAGRRRPARYRYGS